MLLTQAKNYYPFPILDNETSPFCHSCNDNIDHNHQQHYPESSSPSLTDPNYQQNQGSNSHTNTETETKERPQPQSPFIKRVLLVDDDPDLTLTFKAGLE